jgi:glycosyltransferase involved in cell wall biosynthesis
MRILFSINGTDFGGTETMLLQIARRLQARGHRTIVLSLKPVGRIGQQLRQHGIPVDSLNMPENMTIKDFVTGIRHMTRWMREQHFDLVHSFLPRSNIMSRIANKWSGVTKIHLSSERAIDLERSRAIVLLNRLTSSMTDAFIAVSPVVRDILIQREKISPEKITIISNGIDLTSLDASSPNEIRSELNIGSGQLVISSVGRLHREKGHIYLLRALAELRHEWPDVCAVIVGEGPEADNLRREADTLSGADNVRFLGFRADVVKMIRASDLFVLPSLEEGFPVTALEAMACSRPIVATEVGSLPFIVVSGQTGLLVPPKNTRALSNAICQLLREPGTREQMGRRALNHVETYFTLEGVLAQLENLYQDLLENGHLTERHIQVVTKPDLAASEKHLI